MGGFGSGKWQTGKKTTDSSKQLNIRFMKKQGLLIPGRKGALSWNKNGNQIGSISYTVHNNRLVLNYDCSTNGGDNYTTIQQVICFDEISCNYGGKRKYFSCPNCGERREILYLYQSRFTCRICANLNYQCQHEQKLDRNYRQTRKIRHKLKTDGFNPDNLSNMVMFKPKGMHQSTFDKLRLKQQRLIELSMAQLVNQIPWLLG